MVAAVVAAAAVARSRTSAIANRVCLQAICLHMFGMAACSLAQSQTGFVCASGYRAIQQHTTAATVQNYVRQRQAEPLVFQFHPSQVGNEPTCPLLPLLLLPPLPALLPMPLPLPPMLPVPVMGAAGTTDAAATGPVGVAAGEPGAATG